MREDEYATIRTFTAYYAVIPNLIQQYRGGCPAGDNLLAEFVSEVDAVNRAAEIQRERMGRKSTAQNRLSKMIDKS